MNYSQIESEILNGIDRQKLLNKNKISGFLVERHDHFLVMTNGDCFHISENDECYYLFVSKNNSLYKKSYYVNKPHIYLKSIFKDWKIQ